MVRDYCMLQLTCDSVLLLSTMMHFYCMQGNVALISNHEGEKQNR
jgi:hypothetical protein